MANHAITNNGLTAIGSCNDSRDNVEKQLVRISYSQTPNSINKLYKMKLIISERKLVDCAS